MDFDSLRAAGAVMGSGGMIVADETTCMVEFSKYFMRFVTEESCGKCPPCRIGSTRLLEILERITAGNGEPDDMDKIRKLTQGIQQGSLCGLGQLAPDPVLSTIRHFEDEFWAHIRDKRCPAFVCKDLISYYIDPERCKACMICLRKCPTEAISGGKNRIHVIDQVKCNGCGTCFEVCPERFRAVKRLSGEPIPPPISEEARNLAREGKKQ